MDLGTKMSSDKTIWMNLKVPESRDVKVRVCNSVLLDMRIGVVKIKMINLNLKMDHPVEGLGEGGNLKKKIKDNLRGNEEGNKTFSIF